MFAELEEGKEKFYAQKNIQIELSSMPKWKEDFSMDLSRDWLHCPIHYSRAFSRVDQFYWTPDFNKADFTQSEQELIHYICKHKELDILNLFIEKGIDLNAKDNNGMTPLYYAIQSNWNEGINILKKHNINMIYDEN